MKKFTLFLVMISTAASGLFAQNGNHQPYVDYWFPITLLNWSPATDSASPFNRGRVPLAQRFIDTLSSPCPVSKSPNVKLSCLSVTNSTTSKNPSQGYDVAGQYDFGFWQYADYFIMWGGSAGEGLILAPNPTWIDAGHRNGVKVMGNIFFPPTVYGGQLKWVNELDTTDASGNYIVADKLIQMASYYGFDGFFLNQETGGGSSATGTAMEGFMAYFQAHKPANMEIMWYDAMTPNGQINYQNALNSTDAPMFQNGSTLESNTIFLNYNWSSGGLTSSANEATTLGRSPYQVHAGIDVSGSGYGTNVNWTSIFPSIKNPKVSVGLFEPSWTFHSSPDPNNIPLFYQREEEFWVGANNDPCNVPGSGWPGLSKYFIEKSVINSWPFVTNFCTGQGTNGFWENGVQASTHQWNDVSAQDILPTWRWVSQSSGTPLSVDWDFTKAWIGGNSLNVNGTLNASNTTTVYLYNTQLAVTANSNLSLTYLLGSVGATNMQVAVAFTDAPTTFYYLDCGSTTTAGWETQSFSLGTYAGKTLCVVGLQFASTSSIANYSMNIGQIALTNATASAPPTPTNLSLTSYLDCNNAELEVFYDTLPASDNIWYYDILRIKPDGTTQWLGRTPNNAYYVKNIKRIDNETTTQIAVVATNSSGVSSTAATVSFTWPANTANDAINLNGSTKYLNAGQVNLNGSAITLEGWVNATAFNSTSPNISAIMGIDDTMQNTALLRLVNNNAQFVLNVGGTVQTLTSATALTAGTWYQIAATYDGAHMTIYIGGVQDTQMAATGTVIASGDFYIGRDSVASASSYFNGSFDELRAWTVARTQSQIQVCSVSDTTAGLAAYWNFNDCNPDTIAYDNSDNGHDAIAQNMSAADWVASTVNCTTGIVNINAAGAIKIYPNPAGEGSNITLELPDGISAQYSIYDETGALVQQQTTSQKLNTLNAASLSGGIYLCRVTSGGQAYTTKFVVDK